MTQRYVMPKGALILILIGLIPAALTMLDLFDLPYALEILIAGAALAGVGILWHLKARYQWKMGMIREIDALRNAQGKR